MPGIKCGSTGSEIDTSQIEDEDATIFSTNRKRLRRRHWCRDRFGHTKRVTAIRAPPERALLPSVCGAPPCTEAAGCRFHFWFVRIAAPPATLARVVSRGHGRGIRRRHSSRAFGRPPSRVPRGYLARLGRGDRLEGGAWRRRRRRRRRR